MISCDFVLRKWEHKMKSWNIFISNFFLVSPMLALIMKQKQFTSFYNNLSQLCNATLCFSFPLTTIEILEQNMKEKSISENRGAAATTIFFTFFCWFSFLIVVESFYFLLFLPAVTRYLLFYIHEKGNSKTLEIDSNGI